MGIPLNQGERVRSAFVGVAVGDALGWPQEQNAKNTERRAPTPELKFRTWTRRSGGRFQPFEETIGAGEYSDDTQLTLCVGRSLLRGDDWWDHLSRVELPAWSSYQRGAGRSVLRAATSWSSGRPPWRTDKANPSDYFATGANGVAMRVLPHVIYGIDNDFETIRRRIVLDGITTHGHSAALIGALMYASGLWAALRLQDTLGYGELLQCVADRSADWNNREELELPSEWLDVRHQMRGVTFDDEWTRTVEDAWSMLNVARDAMESGPLADDEETLKRLGVFDRNINGSGVVTAVAALFAASRAASSPALGLLQTAFLRNADTDTLASMTSALLGAISGSDWMNGVQRSVQDREYLIAIADSLVTGQGTDASNDRRPPVTKSMLDRWTRSLAERSQGDPIQLLDGRSATFESAEELPTKSSRSTTTRYAVRADDGQSLFIVKHVKLPAAAVGAPAKGISHVGVRIRVSSLRASRQFYEDVLGLSPSKTGESFARYGDAFALEVAAGRSEQLRLSQPHFVIHLDTPTVDSVHRAVLASGAKAVEPLREERGRSRFTCCDPDGNLVEVVAPATNR